MTRFSSFIILLLLLTACSPPTRIVKFTASNTGIPVLLSQSDRIGSSSNKKCSTEKITEDSKIKITMDNLRAAASNMGTGAHGVAQKSESAAYAVDSNILKKTLGDKNTNVCIDTIETIDLGIAILVGVAGGTSVTVDAHIENIENENNITLNSAEEQR